MPDHYHTTTSVHGPERFSAPDTGISPIFCGSERRETRPLTSPRPQGLRRKSASVAQLYYRLRSSHCNTLPGRLFSSTAVCTSSHHVVHTQTFGSNSALGETTMSSVSHGDATQTPAQAFSLGPHFRGVLGRSHNTLRNTNSLSDGPLFRVVVLVQERNINLLDAVVATKYTCFCDDRV